MRTLKHLVISLLLFSSQVLRAEITASDQFVKQGIDQEPKVRVLVVEESTTALVEAKGAHRVFGNGRILQTSFQGKRSAVHALYEGVRWGEEYPGVSCLKVEPLDEGASLFVNGIQYKGSVYIHKTGRGCIVVTNELTVEDYLKSVLSVKYLSPLDKEALSACVILERTALYEKLLSIGENCFWHLMASREGYGGYGVTRRSFGVEEAVDWTCRLVLDNEEGLSVDADALLKNGVEHLAVEGLNARQILEKFYPQADFVVIDSWRDGEDIESLAMVTVS
ncbi:SpoIID/LytB domain-containing protein [Chlamydiifrater volucris]|uniref:SpoIID/LytB domain-containing protein n=1 Tax=Chlamydiifrater volucris TaxID=2681470 RepID=UPI001BD00DF0|nr:SpoIID/LytB domain-containing protein [Chlamydiifrater volucris]